MHLTIPDKMYPYLMQKLLKLVNKWKRWFFTAITNNHQIQPKEITINCEPISTILPWKWSQFPHKFSVFFNFWNTIINEELCFGGNWWLLVIIKHPCRPQWKSGLTKKFCERSYRFFHDKSNGHYDIPWPCHLKLEKG